MRSKRNVYKMVLAAMFLTAALVLPFLTGQLSAMGNAFCPMHLPVILCGFFCGPFYGAVVGAIAPILRFAIFSLPTVMPTGLAMSFELLTYGLVSALSYRALPKKKIYIWVALIIAMISGRVVWGTVNAVLVGLGKTSFGFSAFILGAFVNALPGIIIQIVLIPIIVIALNKYAER